MRWFLIVCALALAAAACSSGSVDGEATGPDIIVEAEPTPDTFDASDPEQLSGLWYNHNKAKYYTRNCS